MKAHISHKIFSFAAVLLMVLTPVAETAAQTRISAGSSNGSGNSINAGSNNGTVLQNRISADSRVAADAYHDIWTNHINASGFSTSNRISAGSNGNETGSNHINAGSGSNNGSRINATNSGTTNTGNRINADNSGFVGYGCSKVPGGYCYNPGSRIDATGNNNTPGTNRISATNSGNTNTGNRINADNSGFVGYGCSKVPGGYCYNPGSRIDASNNNKGGSRINASGTSTSSTGNRIDASNNNNGGNRIDASGTSTSSTGNRIDASNNNNNNNRNTCTNLPYPEDIDGHWSEIYVRRLYDLCIVEGYADGRFRPNQPITRAEMLKMGLLGGGIAPNPGCYDNDCGSPFNDLDPWQGPWVRSAYDQRIVQGYSHDRFAPNQHITRAEAVKVVLSTYGIAPLNVSESFFKDVHGWELGWVEKARIIGLVQGIGNGNFDPHRPITRAEAAKIIVKMIEYYDTEI